MKRRAFIKNSSFTVGSSLLLSGLQNVRGVAPGSSSDEACASTCNLINIQQPTVNITQNPNGSVTFVVGPTSAYVVGRNCDGDTYRCEFRGAIVARADQAHGGGIVKLGQSEPVAVEYTAMCPPTTMSPAQSITIPGMTFVVTAAAQAILDPSVAPNLIFGATCERVG